MILRYPEGPRQKASPLPNWPLHRCNQLLRAARLSILFSTRQSVPWLERSQLAQPQQLCIERSPSFCRQNIKFTRYTKVVVACLVMSACSQGQSLPQPQKQVATLQCGEAGIVQYITWTDGDATNRAINIGSTTWNGTEEGGSMRFFTPDRPSPASPWMNFYQDKAWLYLNYRGNAGWADLFGDQSSRYSRNHPELKTFECRPVNRDDKIVGFWQSSVQPKPWVTISYTGDNSNTFRINACDDSQNKSSCISYIGYWTSDTTFRYQSSESSQVIGQVNVRDDEITLRSGNQTVDTLLRRAETMLCSINGNAAKQATIRVGTLIKMQWSDGPRMTYRPVAPANDPTDNPMLYEDTLGGRWKVDNSLQGARPFLKLVNIDNRNTIDCQPRSERD